MARTKESIEQIKNRLIKKMSLFYQSYYNLKEDEAFNKALTSYENNQQIEYISYIGLIKQMSGKYSYRYKKEYPDILSQANFFFCLYKGGYLKELGLFSTYLYKVLNLNLFAYCKSISSKEIDVEIEDISYRQDFTFFN